MAVVKLVLPNSAPTKGRGAHRAQRTRDRKTGGTLAPAAAVAHPPFSLRICAGRACAHAPTSSHTNANQPPRDGCSAPEPFAGATARGGGTGMLFLLSTAQKNPLFPRCGTGNAVGTSRTTNRLPKSANVVREERGYVGRTSIPPSAAGATSAFPRTGRSNGPSVSRPGARQRGQVANDLNAGPATRCRHFLLLASLKRKGDPSDA